MSMSNTDVDAALLFNIPFAASFDAVLNNVPVPKKRKLASGSGARCVAGENHQL